MHRVKGFTLIELMVTIAVAAVLLGIAVPSFQGIARNNAVKATANDLVSTITAARQQSMSTRSAISVLPSTGGWNKGWKLDYADNSVEEDGEFFPRRNVSVSRTQGSGALLFLARGGIEGGGAEFKVSHDADSSISQTFCVSFFGKVTAKECS